MNNNQNTRLKCIYQLQTNAFVVLFIFLVLPAKESWDNILSA